jgi:uncharacterized Tic20 family protein
LSVALRNGATCTLRDGALTIGDATLPLRELVSATLVADTSVAVAAGMPPAPAVALRLASGASYFLTPIEQTDAGRLLQAIHAARPDLARPAAPPPPYGYGPNPGYPPPGAGYGPNPGYPPPGAGYGPPYGYAPGPGYAPLYGAPSETDRTLAGLCHLSVFFAPFILPLIIWLAMRESHPYASQQAKQAFWFHLILGAIGFVGVIILEAVAFSTFFATASLNSSSTQDPFTNLAGLGSILAFYGVLGAIGLVNIIFSIIAAVQAFQGKPFHYPLLGGL